MDPFSLKRENRKKFQDKQKLKRSHPTSSARKYRILNRQKQAEEDNTKGENGEDETIKEAPNNLDRYDKEDESAFDDLEDTLVSTVATNKLKEVIKAKEQNNITADRELQISSNKVKTTRDLASMDIKELNTMLQRTTLNNNIPSQESTTNKYSVISKAEKSPIEPNTVKKTRPTHESLVPPTLNKDEDFLDGLI
ncbi:hypothetical protein TPHA_0A05870 [Tetrapisispora phaffii CBS 4417]|uniref:Uncharacterized protein n=1 Tax=Tetrapisispora phaffii (strain ATCC 24235 / CBS 4417 / NBRC 1672 / NRRL Y-8282 / UCD 70-5) TaxID=1071381 RepID=G8BP33_TETPH|nr:hypothetical protein TPHA_0A05870 [Tetrapisispora phaffii CBS 4417]CCE61661.1 hypothetical protein TPHA_0A05870 [Tetrapisispora phaffii CBS 4417]